MKTPLLSIITPVYNGKEFIESCLQSVINQNCPEAEHLIIDGGSTDGTVDIVNRYAGYFPHIRCVSKIDHSQSIALNRGIFMAKGKFIGILNCDDYYEPDLFPRILKLLCSLPQPSLLVGNCKVLNDEGKVIYLNKPSRLSLTNVLIGGEKNQFPFNPSAYFYHKSLHNKIGLYDVSDHYTMDLDFILRAVKTAHIRYRDEVWGNFRFIKGTKTFESKENNQLEPNKRRVMEFYLRKLPWFHQGWIKTVRFLFVEQKHRYYMGRIKDCLKDPQEIPRVLLKKLGYRPKGKMAVLTPSAGSSQEVLTLSGNGPR